MVIVRLFGIIMLLAIANASSAQVNRYMVFFKDKNGTAYSISRPAEFLSAKAIARRLNQAIVLTEQDLPVNANYVQGVGATGAEVYFRSKWFNGVLVQCDQNLINQIANISYVDHVEFVAPQNKLIPRSGRTKLNLGKKNRETGSETADQLNQLGIHDMHQAGFRGKGMTIAILDAGFQGVNTTSPFQHLFSEGKVNLEISHDFIYNTDNVFQYDDHGTQVLSTIAADVPDLFTGGAPEAHFQLYVTEDANDEHRIEEYNWAFAAERADSSGADIINSSLGYYDFDIASMNYTKAQMDGQTTVVTKAAQWAADRGILVVCSAGNEGNIQSWQIISAPADAKDVLAVGSVSSQGVRSNSSSKGPTADGRIKPDVVARGVAVRVINSSGSLGSATGTSLSAPLITALVAGVWQRYPDLTNKEIMELVRNSASQANNPDNLLGYGIPNFKAIVNYYEHSPQENLFEVYPNPTTDTIHVSPQDPEQITSCAIELISATGQILLQDTAEFSWLNRVYSLNIRSVARGMYYVRVWYQNKGYVFKVVKE